MAHNSPFNKQSIAVFIAIILLSALSCTPKPPISDKDYIISISLKSSLADKQIADNTELVLIEKGKTESLKTYTENGLAVFSFEAPENTELNMVLIVSESTGHDGFIYNFTTTGNKSIELSLAAKTFSVPISFTTTSNNNPVGNISYSINIDEITGETDTQGKELIPFTLNTNEYNEGMDTKASFDFEQSNITKPMHYDRTIIVKEENKFTFDLTIESYQHTFNVTTSGNIKTPLLTESVGTITYDNETTSFDPKIGIVSFVSDDETENGIKVQVSNVEGYKNGEIIINNIGSRTKNGENYNIELEGIIYDATQPLIVTDGENPISGASIAYIFGEETGTVNTTTNGTTSVNFTNLETDENNLPLDEYILNTTTTKTGYPESTNKFNISTGMNDQITISMGANKYWMTGNVTPTENVTVTGYKNEGEKVINTTINNGSFATDTIQSATDNYTLDSLIFNAEGFIPKKLFNFPLNKNTVTIQNADLEEEEAPTEYTYWLTGTGTPENTTIKGWKDGITELTGTLSSGTYETNHITNTNATFTLDSIIFTAPEHIKQKLTNQTLTQNQETTKNFALEEEPPTEYTYWIEGTGTTPTNTTTVKGYLDGEIFTANTNNGTFETNHINKTETTITLDSIVFTAPGYTKFKEENFTMNPNGTNKSNITLQEIPVINNYDTQLIITDVTGDDLITGTLKVYEPDGDIQTINLNGSTKIQNVTISGDFNDNATIKFVLEKTGYDGLTGTINQNLKLPITSVYDKNETKTDTLTVPINKITGEKTYIAFMDKTTRDDYDVMSIAGEGGNSEYNYLNGNGEREQNIILLTQTEQGTETPAIIQQYYNEAVAMHNNKLKTKQGLELMKINYTSAPDWTGGIVPPGTFLLKTDDTQMSPANTKIGNLPESYNRGATYLRTFDTQDHDYAVSEVGECIIPLKDKQTTGSNEHNYIWNGDVIQDVKIKPLRVALMYKCYDNLKSKILVICSFTASLQEVVISMTDSEEATPNNFMLSLSKYKLVLALS